VTSWCDLTTHMNNPGWFRITQESSHVTVTIATLQFEADFWKSWKWLFYLIVSKFRMCAAATKRIVSISPLRHLNLSTFTLFYFLSLKKRKKVERVFTNFFHWELRHVYLNWKTSKLHHCDLLIKRFPLIRKLLLNSKI